MDAKHNWYRAQRLAIAKSILRCERYQKEEAMRGRQNSFRMERATRMKRYYRNRLWFLHTAEQRHYYGE